MGLRLKFSSNLDYIKQRSMKQIEKNLHKKRKMERKNGGGKLRFCWGRDCESLSGSRRELAYSKPSAN